MPEEWLTYREIGARLGLNVEAVRTRVRRAGWRTQPGNDGRARILVPDRVFVEPVGQEADGVNEGVNKTGDMTGLVALLTAAEARVSRLEKQVEAERDRVNEARSEVNRLRMEVTDLTARADRAEQASTRADQAEAGRVEATDQLALVRAALDQAQAEARKARDAAEALRKADSDRKARGLVARLRAAWRGP
jgi:hypothetical protein